MALAGLLFLLLAVSTVNAQQIIATIELDGAPGRVGIDVPRNLIYVPDLSNAEVAIVDGATNTIVGTLPPAGAGYSFDVPVTALVDLGSDKIFVGNAPIDDADARVTVLDRVTNNFITDIVLPDQSADMAIDEAGGLLYVALRDTPQILPIDVQTFTPQLPIVLPGAIFGGELRPRELAFNPVTGKLYLAAGRQEGNTLTAAYALLEIDGALVSQRLTAARNVDVDVLTDTIYALVTTGGGLSDRLFAIDANNFFGIEGFTSTGAPFSLGLAYNPTSDRNHIAAVGASEAVIIGPFGERRLALLVGTNRGPRHAAVNATTSRAYYSNRGLNSLTVVDDSLQSDVQRFTCYDADDLDRFEPFLVDLEDSLVGASSGQVRKVASVCLPTRVNGSAPGSDAVGLICYDIASVAANTTVGVDSELASHNLDLSSPKKQHDLCVPGRLTFR